MRGRFLAVVVSATLLLSLLVEPGVRAAPAGASPARPDIDVEAVAARLPLTLDLGVDRLRHVLGGDGEVYVTADDEVVVLDLDGDLVGLIEDLPGAGPMTLSPDGESLFVGLQGSLEVVMFDVEDLTEVWAWDVPARPRSLLATDDLLQVGVGQTGSASDRTALVTIPADEEAEPTVRGLPYVPILARDDDGLVIAHGGLSPGSVSRRTVEGAPLAPPVERSVGGNVRDIRVDPRTGAVWIAGSGQTGPSYSVHALDPVTLETTRSIPIGTHPHAVAPLDDGRHVAAGRRGSGGYDVTIHRLEDTGTTLVAGYDLPGQLVTRGLSLTQDGTLAILTNPLTGSGGGWLTLVPDAHLAVTQLLLDATAPIGGQPITIAGELREMDGTPISGADITVVDPRGGQSHATTDVAGRFTATIAPGQVGASVEAQVVFAGDAERRPVIVQQTLTLRPAEIHPYLDDRTYIAGHPSVVRGRVLSEPALLRPNIPVTIEIDGQVRGTVLSGADGFYELPVTLWEPGVVTITARVDQDATHLAGSSTGKFTVLHDRSLVRIDATKGTARSTVTLTGRVLDGLSRPIAGRAVDVRVEDDHGVGFTRRPTTDADGRWTTTFTPRHGGNHAITAKVSESGRFSAGLQTRDIQIARAPTTTSLASLPKTVDHGTRLTLTGRVTAPPGAMLDLVAVDLATGKARRLARAQVDSTGRLSHQVTARANTRYEARFRGDATYAPSTAKRTVNVRATVTAKVSGHDRTVDGVPSFAYGSRPTVTGRVRSVDPSQRVHVLLQRRRDGAWVTTYGWYARPDETGRVSTRVPLQLVDGRYRVRISTSETPANLQGRSPWAYFRVRP